jgi:negative regulator of sigma E activity
VSDERHDEIAARLRAEARATAPERLRADVMLLVRAEPRPRRIGPRSRRPWRPLGAVAAVACVLAALVVGLSHGAGGSPEASLTGAGGGATSAGASRAPELSGAKAVPGATERALTLHRTNGGTTKYTPIVPSAAARAIRFRAGQLPWGLRQALESLPLGRGRGAH